jgi:CheY-like chemotaxis protein
MMPVMDGLQMLRTMRSDARHRRTPVILMSAAGLDTLRAADWVKRRKAVPWDAFLAKPFDPSALLAALRAVLGRRR